ncbi:MAG: hypothetical protein LBI17_03225 [Rickettsiales bacterium]|jgi:hypothetical protein|nr:hypothetical protein [Rickettsiales bacterium]
MTGMSASTTRRKDSLGLSVLEIVLAIAVVLAVAPFAYRFAFSQLSEVKYLNAAKQVRSVRQALLNYTVVNNMDMTATSGALPNMATGTETLRIQNTLKDYGLDEDLANKTDGGILKGSKGRYFKVGNNLNVCVSIDMDSFGFDEIGLRQALLYVGDSAGYGEGCDNTGCESFQSVTGAWSISKTNPPAVLANLAILTPSPKTQAATCIDNETLEAANKSNVYLYRNENGSNEMQVDLKMGGYNIWNFNTAQTNNMTAVPELKFGTGTIGTEFEVTRSLILNGILLFDSNAFVKTPQLLVGQTLNISAIVAEEAMLVKRASESLRATLRVVENAILPRLRVQDMTVSHSPASGLRIEGYDPILYGSSSIPSFTGSAGANNKLELRIRNMKVDRELSARFISVRSGYFAGAAGSFSTANGNVNVSGTSSVNIYNMGQNFAAGSSASGFKLNDESGWINVFEDAANELEDKIRIMPNPPEPEDVPPSASP